MILFDKWDSIAEIRYHNFLIEGGECKCEDYNRISDDHYFIDSKPVFELWDDIEKSVEAVYGKDSEDMIFYAINMLYEEYKKQMHIVLYDVAYNLNND